MDSIKIQLFEYEQLSTLKECGKSLKSLLHVRKVADWKSPANFLD